MVLSLADLTDLTLMEDEWDWQCKNVITLDTNAVSATVEL